MRLSWWLVRIRRTIVLLLAVLIVFLFLKVYHGMDVRSPLNLAPHSTERKNIVTENSALTPPLIKPKPSQWLLVMRRNRQSDPCHYLAATFSGWHVVLIQWEKPISTRHSRCHYFANDAVNTTKDWSQRGNDDMFMAAVLYAIKEGADSVFVPDQVSDPFSLEQPEHLNVFQKRWLTASVTDSHFPAQKHAGCDKVMGDKIAYSICHQKPPSIEVISREKACDSTVPSVRLKQGAFGDFHWPQSRVWQGAFWTLSPCLSFSHNDEDCHKWALMVQHLLWLSGETISMGFSNNANTASTLGINQDFFKTYNCQYYSWKDCANDLLNLSLRDDLVSYEFVRRQMHWIETLLDLGTIRDMKVVSNIKENCSRVEYMAVGDGSKPNGLVSQELYNDTCHSHPPHLHGMVINMSSPWLQMKDIVLIVVFNNPHYQSLPYVEAMYGSLFPNILYCVPSLPSREDYPWITKYLLSFITFRNVQNHTNGAFAYECMIEALTMNYKVSGYLMMADDMLLLPHTLPTFNKASMWFLPKKDVRTGNVRTLRECRLGMCDFHPHWRWWEDYQTAILEVLQEMPTHSPLLHTCYKQLSYLNGGEFLLNGAYSDIFYIPRRLKDQAIELLSFFRDYQIFVELVVPSVINCLEGLENVEPLKGLTVWTYDRDMSWLSFTPSLLFDKVFLHPVKWSYLVKGSSNHTRFYCTHVMPLLFDRYGRIKAMQ